MKQNLTILLRMSIHVICEPAPLEAWKLLKVSLKHLQGKKWQMNDAMGTQKKCGLMTMAVKAMQNETIYY